VVCNLQSAICNLKFEIPLHSYNPRMYSPFYELLTPHAFRERLAAVPIAYLPLGTLEWHGEHLPLGSDGLQSRGFFARIAEEIGGIVLPMLTLGPDRRRAADDLIGMDYADTTVPARKLDGSAYWVEGEIFDAMIDASVRALARAGFKIIVAHGHGPSTLAFRDAMPALEQRYGVRCHHCWLHDAQQTATAQLGLMIDHAAANETSLMMALHPELVRMDLAPADPDAVLTGVGGPDPRIYASAAHGEACMAHVGERLKALLRADLAALRGDESR
jgi:creatinine amidohydrolase